MPLRESRWEGFEDRLEAVRGTIVSIQPRTAVWRYSLDNRTHSLLGYNLFLNEEVNGLAGAFSVAISKKQQQKAQFCLGDKVKGTAWTKMYAVTEYAGYYRAGALKVVEQAAGVDMGVDMGTTMDTDKLRCCAVLLLVRCIFLFALVNACKCQP